jgi:undecaprenyl-diphosphatase
MDIWAILWSWDVNGFLALNQFVGANPNFDNVMLGVARNHLLRGGIILGMLWWCWTAPNGRIDFLAIRALIGAILAIGIGRALQNLLPQRARPLHDPDVTVVLAEGVDDTVLAGWSSFPSDTTILFFALATAIWSSNRGLGLLAFAWSLIVICLPRVYFGFHHPSDIVAGAFIGTGIMWLALRSQLFERMHNLFDRAQLSCPKLFPALIFLASFEAASLFEGSRRILRDMAKLVINIG